MASNLSPDIMIRNFPHSKSIRQTAIRKNASRSVTSTARNVRQAFAKSLIAGFILFEMNEMSRFCAIYYSSLLVYLIVNLFISASFLQTK